MVLSGRGGVILNGGAFALLGWRRRRGRALRRRDGGEAGAEFVVGFILVRCAHVLVSLAGRSWKGSCYLSQGAA